MMPIVITAAADLDPGRICQIAAGQRFEIAPALLEEVDRRCAAARAALRAGDAVYGVNTGMGALVGVRLTESEQLAHQRNLLLARATGGPPWLAEPEVRALFVVRLRTFLSGDSGVSANLCLRLAEFLDAGILPAVPRTGIGSAGEIIPLAHAFGPLVGIGRVLEPAAAPPPAHPAPAHPAPADPAPAHPVPADDTALPARGTRPAAEVLRVRGLGEFSLGPREGHALLAGVPGATALMVLRLAEAQVLEAWMESSTALSVAAAGASRDPYAPGTARGDEVVAGVLARVRAAAGELTEPHGLQAPVSFRVGGPVLAHVLRAAGALAGACDRALGGVTDSPAFIDGRFTGTAGFHGVDLAAHGDGLTAALAHAAEVSAARLHRLLDPRVTGLPAQLAARPGPDAGLVAVHKRAAGEVHAMRRLAVATPVGLIETSGGQEDVQSFAWEASEVVRQALNHSRAVTACELLAGYQACALSSRPAPPGCRPVLDRLDQVVAPITADRPFGEDIERIIGMLGAAAAPG